MKAVPNDLHYIFDRTPDAGDTMEVAPGVHWLRMPLPFRLDHINLWLLDDGVGWTAVDTGIARAEVQEAWERIFATRLGGRPLVRVIVTHFHPDHMGLAGWLTERFGVRMWATLGEWAWGRALSLEDGGETLGASRAFYSSAGFTEDMMVLVDGRQGDYARKVSPIPGSYRRIADGDVISVGGRDWRVIVGTGHSVEHACLHCAELGVLISGDQVLPRISPNISVWPQEPEANPLRLYLDSLIRLRRLPDQVRVLPSHGAPFVGLHARLDEMTRHHDDRLGATLAACTRPETAIAVLRHLFRRELDDHELFFAIGESLAHLHLLIEEGRIERVPRGDGVDLFRRTEAAVAPRRASAV